MIKFKKYLLLIEKKEHIIKKIPNLSDHEKRIIIRFFMKHPNYENKIDWNNWKKLTFEDFLPLLKTKSKTSKTKDIKKLGIKGLEKNKDYIKIGEFIGEKYLWNAYIPLNYESVKYIASKYIGGCEGKWCIAQHNDKSHYDTWYHYNKYIFIILVSQKDKFIIGIRPDNDIEIWDKNDKRYLSYEIDGINTYDIVNKIKNINKIRKQILRGSK